MNKNSSYSFLLGAVFVVVVVIGALEILYLPDNGMKINAPQGSILSQSSEELITGLTYDVVGVTPPMRVQAEMTRRLIIELKSFNQTTTLFSVVLIGLTVVQIILAVIKR